MHPSQEVDSIRLAVREKIHKLLSFFVDQLIEAGKGVLLCSTKTTFPTLFYDSFCFCAACVLGGGGDARLRAGQLGGLSALCQQCYVRYMKVIFALAEQA
jgi:hypothetical protein